MVAALLLIFTEGRFVAKYYLVRDFVIDTDMVDMYRLTSEVRYTNVYVSAHYTMVLVTLLSKGGLGKPVKYRDLLDPSRLTYTTYSL